MMRSLLYPARLFRNAIVYYRKTGMKPTLRKLTQVVQRWLGATQVVQPISKTEYHNWIKKYEKSPILNIDLKLRPLISILMPVFNVEEKHLLEAIESIKIQDYSNWEVCMVDDASTLAHVKPMLEELATTDKRIKVGFNEVNQHISLTTNKAFELSSGEYILLMDNDDMLAPNTLLALVEQINIHPRADLIYFDEDKIDRMGDRFEPFFKPNTSPEMLLETMYPVHALYSADIFKRAGKLRKGFEGSQDYDLALRVFEITEEIYHIPHILYHWRITDTSTAATAGNKPYVFEAARKSISEAIERRGYTGKVTGDNYPFKCEIEIKGDPTVEIIIPTKDKKEYLVRVINSIRKLTTYKNYSITIVDNNSVDDSTLNYFEQLKSEGVNIIKYDKPFNYSAINNFAANLSKSEYILFLNNDTEVITKNWIEELLRWAQMDKVGAVGCKLLFPDAYIQHAGVAIGIGPDVDDKYRPVACHIFYRELEGTARQFNQLNMVQNFSAVTAACLMIKKAKFFDVGGFNEKDLAVAYNDVDLCLKLHAKGLRNVYTPHSKLIHFESISRSKAPARSETDYMYKTWGEFIEKDPYYNPNFDRKTTISYVLPA